MMMDCARGMHLIRFQNRACGRTAFLAECIFVDLNFKLAVEELLDFMDPIAWASLVHCFLEWD